jgi:excisionase family DNA binding protein
MHDYVHMSQPTLINTAEAARMLGVSRSTLTRWVSAGKIEAHMVVPGYRGPLLFDPAEILRYLERRAA